MAEPLDEDTPYMRLNLDQRLTAVDECIPVRVTETEVFFRH
jgi:hypothetical protein